MNTKITVSVDVSALENRIKALESRIGDLERHNASLAPKRTFGAILNRLSLDILILGGTRTFWKVYDLRDCEHMRGNRVWIEEIVTDGNPIFLSPQTHQPCFRDIKGWKNFLGDCNIGGHHNNQYLFSSKTDAEKYAAHLICGGNTIYEMNS